MGWSSETRFDFGSLLMTFGKTLRMRECAIVLGSRSFRESRQKSGSTVRLAGKGWKPSGGKVFVFLLVAWERSWGRERLAWSSVVPHGWI